MLESRFSWKSFKAESATVAEKLKQLVHEGNVRRVIVEHDGRTVAEFPLTAGVVGAVLAPVAAGIGALVAALEDCTIHVERTSRPFGSTEAPSVKRDDANVA
jgi:hypothetical protein